MTFVQWLFSLGSAQAARNVAGALEARRQAEARVDAVAHCLVERIPAAA